MVAIQPMAGLTVLVGGSHFGSTAYLSCGHPGSVLFDDCAGNEAVTFEVSNPDFLVDGDLRLVAQRDVRNSGQVLFIHGLSQHADDMAQVDVVGAPARSSHSLREVLGVDRAPASRLRRSLLVPPMFVIENQRANFPRIIGKVIPNDLSGSRMFRLTGKGADEDPVGVFSIDRYSGEVSVSRSLDREVISVYQLTLRTFLMFLQQFELENFAVDVKSFDGLS
ncbi:hypothetical protein ACEWY4_010420 [Coilia grayii]|uniref:Cadherin-13 n=1 Tax=Coilia grayii TaxID=363190 RepID=A0ABD1K2H0_9TELE